MAQVIETCFCKGSRLTLLKLINTLVGLIQRNHVALGDNPPLKEGVIVGEAGKALNVRWIVEDVTQVYVCMPSTIPTRCCWSKELAARTNAL